MPGPPCSVATALQAMTEGERALFERALTHPGVTRAELARMLRAAGHPVSGWILRHHARRECKCFTTT